ncbi:MAG: aromatic acid exporter family protein [Arthrobacter sp.]|uniref:FUSC family protein n=1 Tax=Arthrobacter sp. TaxID=1667 RepID=UPI00347A8D95
MTLSARARASLAPRAMMAAKVALATGIAWLIAPHLPGDAAKYPYYAPLGAVLSMHPTFARSIQWSMQTLLGLILGILLAGVFVLASLPPLLGIMLVTGAGVLLGGMRGLGAGREYVPVSALFVLVLGGGDADGYSFGYLSQMAVGVLVGLAVNILIFPPLTTASAADALLDFRERFARTLTEIADDVVDSWPADNEMWNLRARDLLREARNVRAQLEVGHESARANPRARLKGVDLTDDFVVLNALDSVAFQTKDLTELLAGPEAGRGIEGDLPEPFRVLVAECLRTLAILSTAPEDDAVEAQRAADERNSALGAWMDDNDLPEAGTRQVAGAIGKCLRRMLDVLRRDEPADMV